MYNKIFKMTKEQLRMQMLSGIITEGQYKAMLNEDESVDAQIAALQKQIELLQKKKQTGGKINLTPAQLSKFKKAVLKNYEEYEYDMDDTVGTSADDLEWILFGKEGVDMDKDEVANALGFKDMMEYEMAVYKMIEDIVK